MEARIKDEIGAGRQRASDRLDAMEQRLSAKLDALQRLFRNTCIWALVLYFAFAAMMLGTMALGFGWI